MRVGQKVGPFQIESELGSGAMGQVYLARYIKNGQRAAIKVIATGLRNSTAQARFQREAEVLEQLEHPNIVKFYVISEFEGSPYYAMEFVEGEPLDNFLERRGKLPWDDVVEIGKQVCAALQHAHEKGIIHRDLKPSNLMIMKDGKIKLTDFGIAKDLDVAQLTATNNTVGTAAYMSPEQCRGERNLTHKSDLYSLGVVLYELLVGHKPFEAETTMDLFLAHVQGTFERPSKKVLNIPIWLDNLVCQLLEKKPDQRPFDAAMVSQALAQVAEKIQAQSSAGVDAAKARLADRNGVRPATDARDRQVARELRKSSQRKGKRGKSKQKRVFEQSWFQAVGLAGMLAVVAGLVYVAFRHPSPRTLYDQARNVMASDDFEAKLRARSGPIAQFLKLYGKEDTAEAEQVHRWADEIDTTQREKTLANRKKANITADNDAEKEAREALEAEERVDFGRAKEAWQKVLDSNEVATPEWRSLGLVAERHLRDLAKSEAEEKALQEKIQLDMSADKFATAMEEQEPKFSATRALRFEGVGDFGQALELWQKIAAGLDKELMRSWNYLAMRKQKELNQKIDKLENKEPVPQRLAALDAYLSQVELLADQRPAVALTACKNVLDLYSKDRDPDVAQRLNKFENLAKNITKKSRGS
jgi:tRNA A-37 threonylcarbamoyl transferase component Bud32